LDCIAENGDAAIVYVAHLRWNSLSLNYAFLLTLEGDLLRTTYSLRPCALPKTDGDFISLQLAHPKIHGTWHSHQPAFQKCFLKNAQGSVDWNCLQPCSEAHLHLPNGRKIVGLGYAECLTLSIIPWELPIHELHWGRFTSKDQSLVWVDWRSPYHSRYVSHNGRELASCTITENAVLAPADQIRLELDQGRILRSGAIADTVLRGISNLIQLLPRNLLAMEECKWRSRGTLRSAGDLTSSGWAIHEIVKFKP
jgi:hypothetical protein